MEYIKSSQHCLIANGLKYSMKNRRRQGRTTTMMHINSEDIKICKYQICKRLKQIDKVKKAPK